MRVLILLLLSLVMLGCQKTNTDVTPAPPPDPAGTITANVQFNNLAQLGTINCQLTMPVNGGPPNGVITNQLNLSVNTSNNLYLQVTGTFPTGCQAQNTIASVGAISGLGAITTYPASGFTNSLMAATPGQGYVVRAIDYNASTYQLNRTQYFRVYVERNILSTNNGILGVVIRYQGPY